MDERTRRRWAGTEASAFGYGGVAAVARAATDGTPPVANLEFTN